MRPELAAKLSTHELPNLPLKGIQSHVTLRSDTGGGPVFLFANAP